MEFSLIRRGSQLAFRATVADAPGLSVAYSPRQAALYRTPSGFIEPALASSIERVPAVSGAFGKVLAILSQNTAGCADHLRDWIILGTCNEE
jgi:hypothetical protein